VGILDEGAWSAVKLQATGLEDFAWGAGACAEASDAGPPEQLKSRLLAIPRASLAIADAGAVACKDGVGIRRGVTGRIGMAYAILAGLDVVAKGGRGNEAVEAVLAVDALLIAGSVHQRHLAVIVGLALVCRIASADPVAAWQGENHLLLIIMSGSCSIREKQKEPAADCCRPHTRTARNRS